MKAEFKDFNNSSNWVNGKCGEFMFEAKLFDTGSIFGINDGRVSKLWIADMDRNCIVNYDRGRDKKPKKQFKEVYDAIMLLLENSPKRFE